MPPLSLQNHSWPCPPPLDRHLLWVWRLSGEIPPATRLPALPDTASAHVVLRLGAPFRLETTEGWRDLPPRVVVGSFDEARTLESGGQIDNVGLYLPPGCTCLLSVPPAQVKNQLTALSEVAPELDRALAQWVEADALGASGLEALLAIVASHVRPACDPLVEAAARALLEGDSVADVADGLGLSRRQLTRRFEAKVGRTPRDFVRVGRFSLAWQTAASQPGATWATVAAEAGYSDQPHLDRDFRALAGAPPTRVFPGGSVVQGQVVTHPFQPGLPWKKA